MPDFYANSNDPADESDLDSSVIRAEFAAIALGFTKIAGYSSAANRIPHINAGATSQTTTAGFEFDGTTLTAPNLTVTTDATVGGTLDVTGVTTLTAQPILSSLTASQAVFTDGSKGLVSNAITGTGNVVMSASPTLTGTINAAALTLSGNLTVGSLTPGRMPRASTGGLLLDDANSPTCDASGNVAGAAAATLSGWKVGSFGSAGNQGSVKILGSTSGTATLTTDATVTTVTLDKPFTSTNSLSVTATEGVNAQLNLWSDDGDDNADKWALISDATTNFLAIRNSAVGGSGAVAVFDYIGNLQIGLSTDFTTRSTTQPTRALTLYNGTAPVGTLTNGVTFYSASGEARVMDAAGNSTLLSPHNTEGRWIYDSVSPVTGKHLRVDMEMLVKAVNDFMGTDFVHESEI